MNKETASSNENGELLTIFIGGLPGEIDHSDVQDYFNQYNVPLSVFLKFKNNGLCAGYGVIKLQNQALYDLICKETHVINGR